MQGPIIESRESSKVNSGRNKLTIQHGINTLEKNHEKFFYVCVNIYSIKETVSKYIFCKLSNSS